MSLLRKYMPLLAGPLLLVLFFVTGLLIGPRTEDRPGTTVYERARMLQKRSDALRKAETLLEESEAYLGLTGPDGMKRGRLDPRDAWRGLLEELPAGSYTWREAATADDGATFELQLSGTFPEVCRVLAGIDGAAAGFAVEEMVLKKGTGNVVDLTVRVSAAAVERESA